MDIQTATALWNNLGDRGVTIGRVLVINPSALSLNDGIIIAMADVLDSEAYRKARREGEIKSREDYTYVWFVTHEQWSVLQDVSSRLYPYRDLVPELAAAYMTDYMLFIAGMFFRLEDTAFETVCNRAVEIHHLLIGSRAAPGIVSKIGSTVFQDHNPEIFLSFLTAKPLNALLFTIWSVNELLASILVEEGETLVDRPADDDSEQAVHVLFDDSTGLYAAVIQIWIRCMDFQPAGIGLVHTLTLDDLREGIARYPRICTDAVMSEFIETILRPAIAWAAK